jgi:cell division septation protein DedD
MKVEGQGDAAFAASTGSEPNGRINVDAVPEQPVSAPAKAPAAAPAATSAPAAQSAKPVAAPTPAAGGATIQLGAFSSPASANSAWKALSGRFKYLTPLTQSVIPVTVNGRTLYRLRASGPDAASICGRLRVAGETCVTV